MVEKVEMGVIEIINKKLVLLAIICLLIIGTLFGIILIFDKVPSYTNIFYLFVGILGGFVSIKQRMKKMSAEEMVLLAKTKYQIFLIPIYGGIFSLLLYVLFISGMVQGSLFPNFIKPVCVIGENPLRWILTTTTVASAEDFGKMLVWSFAAGFSERLVPNFLGKLSLETTEGNK